MKNLLVFISVVVLSFDVLEVTGKIYDKCSLARELHRYRVPKSEIPDWVCIAEHESTFNTKAVGKLNADKSKDWGLFQLNGKYWCQPPKGKSANACKISCESLLSDNIEPSLKCAQLVKKEHKGFSAWVAWNNKCQGRKPNISGCF